MNNKQKIMKMIVKYVMQELCNMYFYNTAREIVR